MKAYQWWDRKTRTPIGSIAIVFHECFKGDMLMEQKSNENDGSIEKKSTMIGMLVSIFKIG